MKHYEVDVDITMSKRISVEAESEEQARAILNGWIRYNPYEYAHSFDAYVKHEITDVNEEEPEEETELDKAIDYVREQLGEERLAVVRAQANVCYEQRRPVDTDYNDEVHDLLEEYGEENGLPDGWWEEYGEIDEWLTKL